LIGGEAGPRAVGLESRPERGGILSRLPISQRDVAVVGAVGVEGLANISGVDGEVVENVVFGLDQLLDDIVNARASSADPKMAF